jgi:hypothetical protein
VWPVNAFHERPQVPLQPELGFGCHMESLPLITSLSYLNKVGVQRAIKMNFGSVGTCMVLMCRSLKEKVQCQTKS